MMHSDDPAAALAAELPASGAMPLVIGMTRGSLVESRHLVHCAVADTGGALLAAWGDTASPVYPRSANKPLQALPLVESGAAEAFSLGDAELALACASHGGEPQHVAVVERWLARAGITASALLCGPQWPSHEASAHALLQSGGLPASLHNNCSGKHAGMLTTARHLGEPLADYVAADHPVQRRITATLSAMTGVDLAAAPCGIDGCSIPTLALPLAALAAAMARFAAPDRLPPVRAAACRRLAAAMAAAPLMVAGHGRLDSALIAATGGSVLCKVGAEGVFTAAVPARGLGLALKVADGAGRAAEVALLAVLRHLSAIDEAAWPAVADFARPVLRNRRGIAVGTVLPVADGGF